MSLFNIPELGMKPKRKHTHPEQPVQKSIVQYLELRGFVFTAPDAGVNVSSRVTRRILKSMGRRPGIADLIVWIPGGTVCIECKKPATYRWSERYKRMVIDERAGTQSDEQKEFQAIIEKMPGHHYFVAKACPMLWIISTKTIFNLNNTCFVEKDIIILVAHRK